jgi:glyoxylase I family protein
VGQICVFINYNVQEQFIQATEVPKYEGEYAGYPISHRIELMAQATTPHETQPHAFVIGVHGIRYLVQDVARSVEFYTKRLGFKLEHQQLPAFANVSLGDAQILLSGPGASGSRPMPDGQQQKPGGWNRVVLKVKDLPGCIAELKNAGLQFRNDMETGPGGRQIQIEDPDGNPIELFEPARRPTA